MKTKGIKLNVAPFFFNKENHLPGILQMHYKFLYVHMIVNRVE